MTAPIYRDEATKLEACCEADSPPEGHDHSRGVYVHSRCHQGSPTWARIHDGYVHIECCVCEKPIVVLAIARGGSA